MYWEHLESSLPEFFFFKVQNENWQLNTNKLLSWNQLWVIVLVVWMLIWNKMICKSGRESFKLALTACVIINSRWPFRQDWLSLRTTLYLLNYNKIYPFITLPFLIIYNTHSNHLYLISYHSIQNWDWCFFYTFFCFV